MKHLKKLASLALALVMVMALAAPAWAAGYTISPASDATSDISYRVYQIFTGTPVENSDTQFQTDTLMWGTAFQGAAAAANKATFIDKLRTDNTLKTYFASVLTVDGKDNSGAVDTTKVSEEFAMAMNAVALADNATGSMARKIAEIAYDVVKNSTSQTMAYNGKLENQPAGYYLVAGFKGDNLSAPYDFMMKPMVNAGFNVHFKDITPPDEPGVVKEVWDEDAQAWTKITDYPVNHEFTFKITATLPVIDADKPYNTVTITDTQDPGFTEPTGFEVYYPDASGTETIQGTEGTWSKATAPDQYATPTATATAEGGYTFSVVINDFNAADPWKNLGGEQIIVTYKTKLRANNADGTPGDGVTVGLPGNVNHVSLVIPGYPDKHDDSTVLTFRLEVDKFDSEDNTRLKGAVFSLYKVDGTNETLIGTIGVDNDTAKDPNNGTNPDTFTWSGLDAGLYKLVEVAAPTGYNAAGPWYYQIDAEYTEVNGVKTLTTFTITPADAQGNKTGTAIPGEKNEKYTPVAPEGSTTTPTEQNDGGKVKVDVNNSKGVQLPSTGGIGTTIFYIVGGVLLVGAVVLLIAKRRTSADEE